MIKTVVSFGFIVIFGIGLAIVKHFIDKNQEVIDEQAFGDILTEARRQMEEDQKPRNQRQNKQN